MGKLMKPISLLSENDWRRVARWLQQLQEDCLEVELDKNKVKVSTVPVKSKVFSVIMLVRVEQWYKGAYESQYFESVEAARR